MKALLLAAALALAAGPSHAATAFFTGNMHQIQSVTGLMGWNCEYHYAGRNFWRAFQGSCPGSIEVQ